MEEVMGPACHVCQILRQTLDSLHLGNNKSMCMQIMHFFSGVKCEHQIVNRFMHDSLYDPVQLPSGCGVTIKSDILCERPLLILCLGRRVVFTEEKEGESNEDDWIKKVIDFEL